MNANFMIDLPLRFTTAPLLLNFISFRFIDFLGCNSGFSAVWEIIMLPSNFHSIHSVGVQKNLKDISYDVVD